MSDAERAAFKSNRAQFGDEYAHERLAQGRAAAAAAVEPKAEHMFDVSICRGQKGTSIALKQMSFDRLAAMVTEPKVFGKKDQCDLVRVGRFDGARRAGQPVSHDGLMVEHDGMTMTMAAAVRALRRHGIQALVYTTASHTPEAPRWRVIVPLAKPITDSEEYKALVSRLNGVLGGALADESWRTSQWFYVGRVEGAVYEHAVIDDMTTAPIDTIDLSSVEPRGPTVAQRDVVALTKSRRAADINDRFLDEIQPFVREVSADGTKFHIDECPNKAEHTEKERGGDNASECTYFPEGVGGLRRALTCRHAHCQGKPLLRMFAEQHGVLEQLETIERSEGRGPSLPSDFDIIELTAAEELAGREQQLRNAASPDAVIEYLRELRDAEPVLSKWVFLAGKMPQASVHRVRDEVGHLTKVGVRDLNAMLRDEQVQAINSRSTKKLQSTIRGRRVVIMDVTGWSVMAEQVEAEMTRRAAPGDYVAFAGLPSRITLKEPPYAHAIGDPKLAPPRVPAIEQLGRGPMLKLAEGAAVVVKTTARGGPRAVPVPSDVREQLLTMTERTAPVVKGLVSHALVLPHTGEIVSADGIHEASRLYFANAALDGARPYGQDEARAALGRLREAVLDGFEFASALDGDVALAALFTGVQRKLLPEAPGVAVLAAAQSSGKTTLLRRLHVVLTGQDMPVQTLSDDSEEVGKRLLATLLQAPAMVVFDNLTDGLTFRSAALAAAITNPVFRQRVLGATQEIEAPTNVLFALTGNNLKFGADEVSRFLVCRLEPRSARPQERTFQHPDVVAHARVIRHDVLRDVVGIVAGHIKAGMKVGRGSRFGLWDDIVRQPLMWAGASDVAECFRQNENLSDAVQGVELLHRSLLAVFGAERFTAANVAWKVLEAPPDADDDPRVDLRSALLMLRAKDPTNESSAGRALGASKGRASPVGRLLQPTVNGRAMYRMEAALD